MTVIPVIDLLQGKAVRARHGQRASYRPWNSPLCPAGAVLPLVRALHDDLGCRVIYFADLDAIQGATGNALLLARINTAFPTLTLWLDAGFRRPADIDALRRLASFRAVVGSECWLDRGPLPEGATILSIDMDRDGLRDPSGLAADPTRYPDNLILMNLSRIGGDAGPDLELMKMFRARNPETHLYLAGGIRNIADLRAARDAGAAGVLLASALHDGQLSVSDINHFS